MTEGQITLLAAIIGGGLGLIAAILSLTTTLYGTVHQARVDKCIRRIYPFVSYKIAKLSAFEYAQKGKSFRLYRFYDKNKAKDEDEFLFVQFKNPDNYKIIDLQVCFSFLQDEKYYRFGSLYADKDIVVAIRYNEIIQYAALEKYLSCKINYYSEANEKLMMLSKMGCDKQGKMTNDRKDILFWGRNYKKSKVILDGLEISVIHA